MTNHRASHRTALATAGALLLACLGWWACGSESAPGPDGPVDTTSAPSTTSTGTSVSTSSPSTGGGGEDLPPAQWQPVDWALNCDGQLEWAPPELAARLLPPLTWDACTAEVPCEQWNAFLPNPAQVKAAFWPKLDREGKVAVTLRSEEYGTNAVYDLVTGEPVAAWRAPLGTLCSPFLSTPAANVLWVGAINLEPPARGAVYYRYDIVSGAQTLVPYTTPSTDREATSDMFIAELSPGLSVWTLGDETVDDIGGSDGWGGQPHITSSGVYFRFRPRDGSAAEFRRWDPVTRQSETLVALRPPPVLPPNEDPETIVDIVSVHATDTRLWWVVGELDFVTENFIRMQLFTAPLPLTEPLPITGRLVRELDVELADNVASDTHFAYHDRNLGPDPEVIRVVSLDGTERVLNLPQESVDAVDGLEFFGDDGDVPNSLWFYIGKGMFSLRVP
ncbi:MAG: hypothetical protein AAGA56_05845 [Myxococcota bacterium]